MNGLGILDERPGALRRPVIPLFVKIDGGHVGGQQQHLSLTKDILEKAQAAVPELRQEIFLYMKAWSR